MDKKLSWEPYDPAWLVTLANEQYPEDPRYAEALARCTKRSVESEGYSHFVDPTNCNKPGAEWQFDENIMLESATEGMIVLDVLKDGRIGGAEFVKKIRKDY